MLTIKGAVLFITAWLYINFQAQSANGLALSIDTFTVGNMKAEILMYEAYLWVLQEYYDNLPWLADIAKEKNKNKDAVIKEIETKISDFKTKNLDALADSFKEIKKHADSMAYELRREEVDRKTLFRDSENHHLKGEYFTKWEELEKQVHDKYQEGRKQYRDVFKFVYEKMDSRKSMVKQFSKHYHITYFTELSAKLLALIGLARHDECTLTDDDSWWTCYVTGIPMIEDVKKISTGDHKAKEFTKTFLAEVKAPLDAMASKVAEAKTKTKDGIDKLKEKKSEAKTLLKDIEKLQKEVADEQKKVKDSFNKWKGEFMSYYKHKVPQDELDAKPFDEAVSYAETTLPTTWDGFFVHCVVAAVTAVVISSFAKNGKRDL